LTAEQARTFHKAQKRLALGEEDAKFHTYRKKDVAAFVKEYADDVMRPFFFRTAQETIDYIIERGQQPNPLYRMGRSRVGCDPCIMVRHSGIRAAIETTPETIERVRHGESFTGHTFFPPEYVPKAYATHPTLSGKLVNSIDDVVRYIQGNPKQTKLFTGDEAVRACMSLYATCE
jgi:hypothetical protein